MLPLLSFKAVMLELACGSLLLVSPVGETSSISWMMWMAVALLPSAIYLTDQVLTQQADPAAVTN